MPTLMELCNQLGSLCQQYEKSTSDNCGTGAGGFQPGNDCASGGSGTAGGSNSQSTGTGHSPEPAKPAGNFRENVTADEFLTALQATGKPQ